MDADIAAYIELLKKGKSLDTEFLRGIWPNYDEDVKTLERIRSCVRSKDQKITEDEISKILEIARTEVAAQGWL